LDDYIGVNQELFTMQLMESRIELAARAGVEGIDLQLV
jgi:hypothetical protein